jgi:Flp pilus assembly protein TadB
MRSRWAIEMYLARQRGARGRARSAGWQNWLPGLALITFVVLKLTGVIDWSWWWVLSPLWISGILLVLGICVAVVAIHLQARRQVHAWMNHFAAGDWWGETPAPGHGDGQGQASNAPGD